MIRKKNYIIIFVSFLFMLIFFSFMFNNSPSSMAEDVGIEIEISSSMAEDVGIEIEL
jgi:hypothetical protein